MTEERAELAQRLYERARSLAPEARAEFIRHACGEDEELREDLLSLVARSEDAETFFQALGETLRSASFPSDLGVAADSLGVEVGDASPTQSSPPYDLPLGHQLDRYRILELVARGGMGTVYRARDLRLGREVALKLLPPGYGADPEAADRLLFEASAAAALEHPNICTVYEVGETEDGQAYLVMAFYEGETLKDRLRRGPLSPAEAAHVAAAMARGLAEAHERDIVHRDIKPGNVILTAAGEVKLVDFGLAQRGDAALTRPGATVGTVAYMSPEQVRGEPVEASTDLWSLGVVLYEMLTGVRPFRGGDAPAVLHAILRKDPVSVREVRAGTPRAIGRIVERLLRKDPAERYPSARDLLTDLERTGEGDVGPELPLRSRIRWRGRPSVRRPLALLGAAAGSLLVLAIVTGWPGAGDSGPAVAEVGAEVPGSSRHRMPSVAAHEFYMRGNDEALLRSDSGVRQAIEYFKQATAADSTYAAAFAGLARMYVVLANRDDPGIPRQDLRVLAERAALKAIALDDSLADGHASLGLLRHYGDRDFPRAEAELKRAVALDSASAPSRQWLAQLYLHMGRAADALEEARGALHVDSLSASAHAEVAHALLSNGRPDEALAQLEQIATVQPPLLRAAGYAAQAYAMKGMWPEAIAAMRPVTEKGYSPAYGLYGYLLARAGQRDEALRVQEMLLERWRHGQSGAFDVALVYAGLGDLDQAFAWLDRSVDDPSSFGPHQYLMMPVLKDLRADPRFQSLAKRLGLPGPVTPDR